MAKCDKGEKKDGRGRCRDYKQEARYHAKPEQVRNRVQRNQDRREAGLKVGDRREVDHIKPLSKGGSGSRANTRVVSRHTNRVKGAKS